MKKLILLSVFIFGIFSAAKATDEIDNLKVQRSGTQLIISWDDIDEVEFDGYALQWGDSLVGIGADKGYRLPLLGKNTTSHHIRGVDFRRDTYYYFRVYTYREMDNEIWLENGSKALKWKEGYGNDPETGEIAITDPARSTSSSSNNNSSSNEVRLGTPSVYAYDHFINVRWSRAYKLSPSELDGFVVQVSTDGDFLDDDETAEIFTDKNDRMARMKGLEAEKLYYVRIGYFKGSKSASNARGWSSKKSVRTIRNFPRDGRTAASRNLMRVEEKSHGPQEDFGAYTPPESEKISTTKRKSSPKKTRRTRRSAWSGYTPTRRTATKNTATRSTVIGTVNSKTEIENRIKKLQREISSLQSELQRLQNELKKQQ